eukprot:TRINITY_DN2960_c0_g1_i1.p1 TRINITY_DN2960_c0_g1~~TRINITY_DN2960_c0_g1_i1.p1  ORF type:complete len:251 (+),score=80.62 TRINITY_DN2960_c0_g1_i1:39-755(+)
MKKEEFIKNHRDVTKGEELPPDYLSKLYDAIIREKIEMESDSQNGRRNSTGPFAAAEKKGYLIKQGGKIKTWKRRWFLVSDHCLFYFRDDQSPEPLGIVPLENLDVRLITSQSSANQQPASPQTAKNKKFTIEIFSTLIGHTQIKSCKMVGGALIPGNHTSYLLCSNTKQEIIEWMNVIKTNIKLDPFTALIEKKKYNMKTAGITNATPIAPGSPMLGGGVEGLERKKREMRPRTRSF